MAASGQGWEPEGPRLGTRLGAKHASPAPNGVALLKRHVRQSRFDGPGATHGCAGDQTRAGGRSGGTARSGRQPVRTPVRRLTSETAPDRSGPCPRTRRKGGQTQFDTVSATSRTAWRRSSQVRCTYGSVLRWSLRVRRRRTLLAEPPRRDSSAFRRRFTSRRRSAGPSCSKSGILDCCDAA